jgi:hypothetical protein
MNSISRVALLALAAILAALPAPAQEKLAQQKPADSKPALVPLTPLIERGFPRWDRDHDDALELVEVDRLIEDHTVHGRLAALIVQLRYHMTSKQHVPDKGHTTDKDHPPALTHPQLLSLVAEAAFVKQVDQSLKHLEEIDRELFLATDPDLATFNQGRLNDCYLLSAIAAQAHRNPKAIREMIHPQVTGGFQVVYGDGQKIPVEPLTDCELLLGARLDQRHGSWLAVVEKSYGIIRKREHARKSDKETPLAADTVPFETLDWGNSGVIISLLTGRQCDSLKLGKSSHPDQVHTLLADVMQKKRLVCVSKNSDQPPPGIVSNHVYAILGYNAQQRHVSLFNPWGNTFTPKGSPGIANGYTTKNGLFSVPLDEFHSVFSNVVYETDRPLKK